jgi:hypothetical protein
MPLFDFVCACGRQTEELVEVGVDRVACTCGGTMERRFSVRPMRAADRFTGVYDPRDDSRLIHNLDKAARQWGLPGYERRVSR